MGVAKGEGRRGGEDTSLNAMSTYLKQGHRERQSQTLLRGTKDAKPKLSKAAVRTVQQWKQVDKEGCEIFIL